MMDGTNKFIRDLSINIGIIGRIFFRFSVIFVFEKDEPKINIIVKKSMTIVNNSFEKSCIFEYCSFHI